MSQPWILLLCNTMSILAVCCIVQASALSKETSASGGTTVACGWDTKPVPTPSRPLITPLRQVTEAPSDTFVTHIFLQLTRVSIQGSSCIWFSAFKSCLNCCFSGQATTWGWISLRGVPSVRLFSRVLHSLLRPLTARFSKWLKIVLALHVTVNLTVHRVVPYWLHADWNHCNVNQVQLTINVNVFMNGFTSLNNTGPVSYYSDELLHP